MLHLTNKFKWKISAFLIILFLIVCTIITFSNRHTNIDPRGQWVELHTRPINEKVTITGALQPFNVFDVSSPVEGKLVEMNVSWGEKVQKGQLLGRISSQDLSDKIRETEVAILRDKQELVTSSSPSANPEYLAALRRMRIADEELTIAKNKLLSAQTLLDKGYIPTNEFEEAQRAVVMADQRKQDIDGELKVLLSKWDKHLIKARKIESSLKENRYHNLIEMEKTLSLISPIDGIAMKAPPSKGAEKLETNSLRIGTYISPRESIMLIGDTSSFVIRGYVGEADINWIRVGLPVRAFIQSMKEHQFAGKIIHVSAQARNQDASASGAAEFEIQVQITQSYQNASLVNSEILHIGSIMRVEIDRNSHDSLYAIPLKAIQWTENEEPILHLRRLDGKDLIQKIDILKTYGEFAYVNNRVFDRALVWIPNPSSENASSQTESFLARLFSSGDE